MGYEDMVDAHPRHAAWVRRLRPMPLDTGLRVSQSRCEALVCPRARDGVEVARKERRLAAVRMAQPLGAKERVDLRQSLGPAESQVRRDHLEVRAADLDGDPQGAARLQS